MSESVKVCIVRCEQWRVDQGLCDCNKPLELKADDDSTWIPRAKMLAVSGDRKVTNKLHTILQNKLTEEEKRVMCKWLTTIDSK